MLKNALYPTYIIITFANEKGCLNDLLVVDPQAENIPIEPDAGNAAVGRVC